MLQFLSDICAKTPIYNFLKKIWWKKCIFNNEAPFATNRHFVRISVIVKYTIHVYKSLIFCRSNQLMCIHRVADNTAIVSSRRFWEVHKSGSYLHLHRYIYIFRSFQHYLYKSTVIDVHGSNIYFIMRALYIGIIHRQGLQKAKEGMIMPLTWIYIV